VRLMEIAPEQLSSLARAVEIMTAATKVAGQEGAATPSRRMPPSEIAAVLFIGRHDGARLNNLAEHLRVGPTTASSIVDRLVKAALVVRQRPEVDRRSLSLSLTEAGQALRRQSEEEQEAWCRLMLQALEPSERPGFVAAMSKIASRLLV
jgi:DNA-binding MarR family transcriptional regulator